MQASSQHPTTGATELSNLDRTMVDVRKSVFRTIVDTLSGAAEPKPAKNVNCQENEDELLKLIKNDTIPFNNRYAAEEYSEKWGLFTSGFLHSFFTTCFEMVYMKDASETDIRNEIAEKREEKRALENGEKAPHAPIQWRHRIQAEIESLEWLLAKEVRGDINVC